MAEPVPATSFLVNFANTSFVNQDGKRFKPADYLGKVVLFNFIYTKCAQVCPLQTKQLVAINEKLSNQYQDKLAFVAISLDSQFDKPAVLKAYAKKMGADASNMQFLSGSYEDIMTLQRKLHLFGNPNNPAHPKVDLEKLNTNESESVLSNHMAILWAIGKNGQLMQRYAASPMDVKRIENELKQLTDL